MSEAEPKPNLSTVTNTYLLEGLQNPDNQVVWQEFVDRYRPLLIKYARRLGLKEADAQDASQQTMIAFCTAYQQGKYDREKGRLRIWLFGIARNQVMNMHRRGKHKEVQVADDSDQTNFFARQKDENELEKIWEEEWRDAVLRQCLGEVRKEVDAKTIEAFELFAWKGTPAQEVAEQLGMTANAVFIAKHRVMKRIKELLPQMEDMW